MMQATIPVQPVVQYPRLAETGKTYVMRVDLQPLCTADEWPYESEEYPVYCMVDALPLFDCRPIGEPVVVLHRFGGTYGPASFLLTASQQPSLGTIELTFLSGTGVPVSSIQLSNIIISQSSGDTLAPQPASVHFNAATATHQARLTTHPLIATAAIDPENDSPEDLLRAYYRSLAAECNHLPLGVIAPTLVRASRGSMAQTKETFPLSDIYVDLDVVAPAQERGYSFPAPAPQLGRGEGKERTPLLAALRQPAAACTVLLGDAGSGKTTFVNYLAYLLAADPVRLPEVFRGRLVVRLALRNVAARHIPAAATAGTAAMLWDALADDIAAHLGQQAAVRVLPHLQRRLEAEGGFILLDGLDDVPEARRHRQVLLEAVAKLTAALPVSQTRVLVTARPYAYADSRWRLSGFATLALAPFSEQQVGRFIERWYDATRQAIGLNPDTAAGMGAQLRAALQEWPYLGDLASRPLLLALVAALHSHWGELPEDRAELYEDAVNLLLGRWQRVREVRRPDGGLEVEPGIAQALGVGERRIRAALEALAFTIHQRQWGQRDTAPADIAEGDLLVAFKPLLGDLTPDTLLSYLRDRAGLLVEREEGVYAFPHRSFQEYLAACHLADQPDFVQQLQELVWKDPVWWREVCLLGLSKASKGGLWQAVYIVSTLLPEEPEAVAEPSTAQWQVAVLAGQASVELRIQAKAIGQEHYEALLKRVRRWLVRLIEGGHLKPKERAEAGDTLGRMGDPRPGVDLTPDGLPDIAWCVVPAGDFLMGDSRQFDSQAHDNERPQHILALPSFRISRYLITNAQYEAFVRDGGYTDRWRYCWTPAGWNWKGEHSAPNKLGAGLNLPNHPVVGIAWHEAIAFCNWLAEKLGQKVSLPGEAQWEKTARGNNGWRFPWGDELMPDHANHNQTGIGTTTAVGILPRGASPYGALDMSGNVWEWCATKWSDYPSKADDDIVGEALRVTRGGSFNSPGSELRCTHRRSSPPDSRSPDCGFRIVSTPAIQSDFSGYSPTELRSRFLREGDTQIRRQLYDRLAQDPGSHRFLLNQHALRMTEAIEPTAEELRRSAEIIDELRTKLSRIKEIAGPYAETIMFGSFARGTAIRPLSDIDALVIFRFNPQLEKPETSYKILDVVLRRIYKTQVVERKWTDRGRNVPGSSFGASILVHLPDKWLEITPAVYSRRERDKLLVPEHNLRRWVPTNYEIHAAFTRNQDAKTDGAYTALVKAVKWWHYHNVPWSRYLTGFMLECLVAADAAPTDSVLLEAFREFLARVRGKYTAPSQLRRISELGVPSGYKLTNLSEANYRRLMALIAKTLDTIAQTDKMQDFGDKVTVWRSVFGAEFPEILI